MKVSFAEVSQHFIGEHPLVRGSNTPAFWNLNKANKQFSSQWDYRSLTIREILGTILFHHDHWQEGSTVQIVPDKGLTVEQAVARYKKLENFQQTNPLCWETIEFARKLRSDIFLASAPLETPDFRPLKRFGLPGLFVLDGLHRLIAWGLEDRYTDESLKDSPIKAFIAG